MVPWECTIRARLSRSVFLLAAMVLSASVEARSNSTHTVTLDDLLSLKGSGLRLALSPDGEKLAYAADGEVWIVSTQTGDAPRRVADGWLPTWSRRGDRLAYYSARSRSTQLWVYDARTGTAKQLTHLAGGIDPDPFLRMGGRLDETLRISWSPDGSHIVFASRAAETGHYPAGFAGEGPPPWALEKRGGPLVLTDTTPLSWTLAGIFVHGFGEGSWKNDRVVYDSSARDFSSRVNQLFVVNTRSGSVQQLTRDGAAYFGPDWSPDGKTILCASTEWKSPVSADSELYTIDLATGKKTALTKSAGDKSMPSWSPDGRRIAYRGGDHFAIAHMFVLFPASNTSKIVPPVNRWVQEFHWLNEETIALDFKDGTTISVAEVDVDGGTIKTVSPPESAYRSALTASRSGLEAWQESGPRSEGLLRIHRAEEDGTRILVDLNPQIKSWELGDQQVIRWMNRRGDDMEGVLIKPVGYEPGRRYPLIVDAYPSQQNSFKGASGGNQAWAARGYAVFWPNARAPHVWMNPFTDQAYSRAGKGPGGWEVTVDDVLSGIDELIARGIVDADRMCLYGFSNGGGIVNYLVTRTTRFKCAVSVGGAVSDWLRPVLLETNSSFEDYEGADDPWTTPAPYVQLSAIFHLESVETPMLLADGDEDGDFLLNTIEMYNGLRHLGKNVTLLRYPGQAHGFTGRALADFWKRENDFFDAYLKPGGAARPPN